ncbi:ATP-dependent Clp protease proteolytic subunit [Bradyrhizobium sp. CIAT3101]|uniref:ATP-dependent Clp protease proteolytic subunit n=1 Tax=Bradyrhizobium sp. CIAT3101 TaxID=439387 RepID=UPI0024B1DE49|nr:ATP-dependent Clp protease proteolytic subunit [Bradyrhizobium sp. CIAT3101]WFU81687.1 ATP-dependent Clp protease proteolytic subunit [Bradyrhizobium sp. CIAT3101]
MTLLKTLVWIGGILLVWGYFQLPSGSGDVASRQTLSVREEPDRIVLGWSGPVQEPMSERVAAALDRYKADRRNLVLILNSPGGSVEHGRKVVAAIRTRDRAIDTLVEKAGVCASMCVPIFLTGRERNADPEAYFMFHQVSLDRSAKENLKRKEFSDSERAAVSQMVKTLETAITDDFFHTDFDIRGVNPAWLAMMRRKIASGDVWMSGQDLVAEGSGVVDSLVRTPAR